MPLIQNLHRHFLLHLPIVEVSAAATLLTRKGANTTCLSQLAGPEPASATKVPPTSTTILFFHCLFKDLTFDSLPHMAGTKLQPPAEDLQVKQQIISLVAAGICNCTWQQQED